MRISAWSSDVCSSDLSCVGLRHMRLAALVHQDHGEIGNRLRIDLGQRQDALVCHGGALDIVRAIRQAKTVQQGDDARPVAAELEDGGGIGGLQSCRDRRVVERSEEQTSELPSLMRHPYAVFCLKKKK